MRLARVLRRPLWATLVGLALTLALAFTLRFLGVNLGLPFRHHWDEPWMTENAVAMLRHGNDMPVSFIYGAPLARLTVLAFSAMRLASGDDGEALSDHDANVTVILVARLVSVVVSSTGVLGVYLASRRAGSRMSAAAALASALLYAVAWELVLHGRYAVTDACVAALTAWTLGLTALYVSTRRRVWAVASVLAAGVAFAFKIPGLLTALIPLGALALTPTRSSRRGGLLDRTLLVSGAPIVLFCFVFFNPHVRDHAVDVARELLTRVRQIRDGGVSLVYRREPGLEHLRAAVWAISSNFLHRWAAVSLGLTAVSVVGLVEGLRRRQTIVVLAVAHAVVVVLADALENRAFLIRNYIVVVPCLCLGFGQGLATLVGFARTRLPAAPLLRRSLAWAAGAAMAVLLVAVPLHDAVMAEILGLDPRDRALDWIADHAREGQTPRVGLTSTVLGPQAIGGAPNLTSELARPPLQLLSSDFDSCPGPGGPDYLLLASTRDQKRAGALAQFEELWLYDTCPGYDRVATFTPSPYEHDEGQTPNWNGRVSAIVLARRGR